MKKSASGLVLLVVLIFLEIFTLLGLYVLQNNVLQKRMVSHMWEKSHLRREANQALGLAAKQLEVRIPFCVVDVMDVTSQPMASWVAHACVGKSGLFQYYYVVEMLGSEACAVVDGRFTASFYRISLLMVAGNGGRVGLQGVWVKASGVKLVCGGVRRDVKVGWQTVISL